MAAGSVVGTVRLSAAELGSNLLMIGAAELAFEGLLDDPAGLPPLGSAVLTADAPSGQGSGSA